MTRVVSIVIRALGASIKSMILSVLIHLLFIPLVIWSIGRSGEKEVVFIGFAVFIIQCILQTLIISIVYFVSVVVLFFADKSALEKSAEHLTARYFSLILVLYIIVFVMAFQISDGRNLPFIICASIPHLIGVTAGLFFLMKELKQIPNENVIPTTV